MKFTPGPWRYDPEYEPDECPVIWNAAGDAVCTLEPDGAWSGEEMEANAALIASAPELYAELQNILNADYRHWDDGYNTAEEFVRWAKSRARNALAKAEGRK